MVFVRKITSKLLNYTGAALGIISSFGIGHAVKGIQTPVVCQTVAAIAPGLYSSICNAGQVANVFTTAGLNATVTAFECVPQLNIDSSLVASCFAPLSGVFALSMAGLVTAALIRRRALDVSTPSS